MPSLYILGWLIVQPLSVLINLINPDDISLLGTLVTFLVFLLILPSWIRYRLNNIKPWIYIGLDNYFNRNILFFLRGLLIAFALISIVLVPLVWGDWVLGVKNVKTGILLNAIVLGLGVGFAEELVFRGWLLGEINYLLSNRLGILIQALIFSLSHIRLDMNFTDSFSLLFGLFLLGIVLGLRRKIDSGSLWGAISLHGGLVGGWFLINSGLIQFSLDSPMYLTGPGNLSPNPIGSLWAILSLLLIIFLQRKALTRL